MRKPCCANKNINKRACRSTHECRKFVDNARINRNGCCVPRPRAAGLLGSSNTDLKPDVKLGNFSEDEDDLIIRLYALLGNRWSLIAGRLPGRTENDVENYWNSHLGGKLARRGIDRNKHGLSQGLNLRHFAPVIDDNIANNAASCLDDDSCVSPELNLDLTIGLPSDHVRAFEEQEDESKEIIKGPVGNGETAYSTLHLFR